MGQEYVQPPVMRPVPRCDYCGWWGRQGRCPNCGAQVGTPSRPHPRTDPGAQVPPPLVWGDIATAVVFVATVAGLVCWAVALAGGWL